MRDKKPVDLPADKHQNLFGLAQAFVNDTKCRINGGLVGRIALMVNPSLCSCNFNLPVSQRKVFMAHPGTDFWDQVDHSLALMHEDADRDAQIIDKFVHSCP